MTLGRNGAENAEKSVGGENDEVAETDERSRFESAAAKIGMCWLNRLLEANDLVMKLGADTANEPVAEGGICRSKIAGRGLVRPSACRSGVSVTSPSVMV